VWGISRERLLDDAAVWTQAIHPADRERVLAAIPRMKEGTYEEEYRIVRSDGTLRWVLDRTFPVRDEAGDVYRIVGIAEDITADKEAAQARELLLAQEQASRHAAERAAAWREEVLAMVSHDLRNPLNSIHLGAAALRDLAVPEEKREKMLDRIISVTQQMDRLIQMLLDTSRLESGHGLPVEPSAVDTGTLIDEACTLFRPQVEAKRIRLECEVPDGCPSVYVDKERILQVFWNLLGNAIKFTPEGGCVLIRSEPEVGIMRFSVTNPGPEIPPEHIERLFDPFWQESRTARLGTGLGLPISKAIVQAHGGRIWLESNQATGTTFFFSLPVVMGPPP
jgi:PAS domain S-box-containing protein